MNDERSSLLAGEQQSSITGKSTFTVSEAIDHYGFGKFNVFTLICCTSAWLILCISMESMAFVVQSMKVDTSLELDANSRGLILLGFSAGSFLTALPCSWLMDEMGRSQAVALCLWLLSLLYFSGAFVSSWQALFALRVISGMVGPVLDHGPNTLYIETTPLKYRGTTRIMLHVGWQLGTVVVIAVAELTQQGNWHGYILRAGIVMIVITAAVTPWLLSITSPHFLNVCGRDKDAVDGLNMMAKWNNAKPLEGTLEPIPITTSADGQVRNFANFTTRVREVFHPSLRVINVIMSLVFFLMAGTNILIWVFYVDFLEDSNQKEATNAIYTAIPSGKIGGAICAVFLIDRVGRVPLVIFCSSICAIATVGMISFQSVPLLWLSVFVYSLNVEMIWIPLYAFAAELYPSTIRGVAVLLFGWMRYGAECVVLFVGSHVAENASAYPIGGAGVMLVVVSVLMLGMRAYDTTGQHLVATADAFQKTAKAVDYATSPRSRVQ